MNPLKVIISIILKLMGWKIQQDIPEIPQKCVAIGAPHVSWVDGFVGIGGAVILRLKMKFLLKSEFFRFPFGPLFRALGGIPVNRNAGRNSADRKKLFEEINTQLEKKKPLCWLSLLKEPEKKLQNGKRAFIGLQSMQKPRLFYAIWIMSIKSEGLEK